jgi:hypothetical protein
MSIYLGSQQIGTQYVDSYELGNIYLGSNLIQGNYPTGPIPTTNLYWNVDANDPASYPGSGSVWYNTVGDYANLLFTGSVTYSGDSNGNYFSFDTGSYHSTSNITIGNRTICTWVYSNTTEIFEYLRYGGNVSGRMYIQAGGGATANNFNFASFVFMQPSSLISVNQWHFISATSATGPGGYGTIWYNGDLNNTNNNESATIQTDKAIRGNIQGRIGQMSIYNSILSAGEIKTYFNNTRGYYGV